MGWPAGDRRRGDSESIAELREELHKFKKRLETIRRERAGSGISWYPYDTLGVFDVLAGFPSGEQQRLARLFSSRQIIDIGCGDGDLSFFLESLGAAEIDCLDYSPTNFNGMKGVTTLKEALRSSVNVHDIDLECVQSFQEIHMTSR